MRRKGVVGKEEGKRRGVLEREMFAEVFVVGIEVGRDGFVDAFDTVFGDSALVWTSKK